ncbi:DsrE family protein [Pseudoteredinibacter isoporae]|uniref:Intracellular sulfur oxidation DsrE/DsrF family protein n=1 Tax=Pseudoteredinibacter isoporae TaxID=570281 RepID=A0A7X0JR35_9GAMM|nr:intracellular sulfur oxidation DsrE/DsrF family protein [Pseudoteredinibacter isoporae]
MKLFNTFVAVLFLILATQNIALAGADAFTPGPQIKNFGENAKVNQSKPVSKDAKFKVAFDVGKPAEPGKLNRNFNSLARFINMHIAAGVKPENIELALVVHGKAGLDLLHNRARKAKELTENPNLPLLKALMNNNTQVFLCGQTAAYYDIKNEDLYDGVQMSLSAMTAHALLQQNGYTVNPF